jgi:hydrogenase expression/formation protein HypC
MCLAAPGKIISLFQQDGMLMGKVDFGGVIKTVCLEYVPQTPIGCYVMVHAGFAIEQVDEEQVQQFYQLWQQVLAKSPAPREA